MTKEKKQELLNKMFPITAVCREDLIEAGYEKKDILKLTDDNMNMVASKLADGMMDDFWIVLKYIAEERLGLKKGR